MLVRQPRLPNRRHPKRPSGAGSLKPSGYICVRVDGRNRFLHRLIMQEIVGRPLLRSEIVHHQDGDRQNNRPENLQLLSAVAHNTWHHRKHPLVAWCLQCGRPMLTTLRHWSRSQGSCSHKCAALWRWRRARAARLGRPAPRRAPKLPIPEAPQPSPA